MSDPADEFFGLLHGAEQQSVPEEDDPLQDPAAVFRQQCALWEEAASRCRFHELTRPGPETSPSVVMEALVQVRARLDTIEVVLGQVMAVKAATAAQARNLEQAADDAWDRQAEAERRRPRPEYQGSKERYAYWNLAIRAERARAREARDLADFVRATYDRVKLHYDGLNETRRDLAARLTHARWETHIEQ
jgi:hypothetical protein